MRRWGAMPIYRALGTQPPSGRWGTSPLPTAHAVAWMALGSPQARRDFTFLRRCREAVEGLAAKVGWFLIMTVMGGLLLALWSGVEIKVAGP